MPRTTRGAASGVSRTVPVWQTRAIQADVVDAERRRRETPTGSPCPGSMTKPNDA